MLDTTLGSASDRRPLIAILPWDTGFRAWDPHDSASGEVWQPRGARVETLKPDSLDGLAEQLVDRLGHHSLSAILLVGRSSHTGTIHIQTRAENRVPGTGHRDNPLAPGIVRTTLPAPEILRDLKDAGLQAKGASEAEDDAGSQLLFRILSALPDSGATPPIGLIRVPRDMAPEQVNQTIRTVASAVSRYLPGHKT